MGTVGEAAGAAAGAAAIEGAGACTLAWDAGLVVGHVQSLLVAGLPLPEVQSLAHCVLVARLVGALHSYDQLGQALCLPSPSTL